MTDLPLRAHVIAGGFPPGAAAGHDHDYARLRLLELLAETEVRATVSNHYTDIERWLPLSRLLITYVAGPFMNDDQAAFARKWLDAGGRWLGLHGTSGGKAVRVDGRRRAMLKMDHHAVLGGFFLNHPPVRRFDVAVAAGVTPLTRGVSGSFEVIDEPYMIEVQAPERAKVFLTAELGPDPGPPGFGFAYERDTALLPDGKTRVLGYTIDAGEGGVTYIALGHCHSPVTNSQPFVDRTVDSEGKTPAYIRTTWETEAFPQLLRNAIAWGMRADSMDG
jgi:type 1 glutamine amidotransferase